MSGRRGEKDKTIESTEVKTRRITHSYIGKAMTGHNKVITG